MRRHNPAFIPRNHLVEEALFAATEGHDLTVMQRLLDVLVDTVRLRARPARVQHTGRGRPFLPDFLRHVGERGNA